MYNRVFEVCIDLRDVEGGTCDALPGKEGRLARTLGLATLFTPIHGVAQPAPR